MTMRLNLGDAVCLTIDHRHVGSVVHLGGVRITVLWLKTGWIGEYRADELTLIRTARTVNVPRAPKPRPKTIAESPRAKLERTLHTMIDLRPTKPKPKRRKK